nr:hypothetical protein [Tanacetum cinerariifolium]
MTKVIKGEFEKLKDLKVKDVSLTCDTSLKVFNNEFNRMSRMDDSFTYEVEVANVPCDLNKDDDLKQRMSHEADDDTGYDPSDETPTYGKIWYDEDVHDLRFVETEFPAIVFDDTFTSEVTPSYEPTISPFNDNKIEFRISFDEFDDEDYTPEVSYSSDLDFFKYFEKEFPAIVYNDALTSKLDFLTELVVSPQHIDEFNLKDKTSFSECDEKEQNILYFNDLLTFNVIYPDDLKSDKENDNDKIDIKQSSRGYVIDTDDGAYAQRLFPSCFVIFDLEPLSLSFDFVFTSEIFKSLSFSLDRIYHLVILCLDHHAHTSHHLESLLTISLNRLDILKEDLYYQSRFNLGRTSLTGFPDQSIRSSNAIALDSPYLLVLISETSQSRQHGNE